MKWLQFFLSHSIFISLCAVALCFQTYILLHLPIEKEVLFFVFFSTLCSYNAYWIISKYSFSNNRDIKQFVPANYSYIILFVLAGTGMLYFALQIPALFPLIFWAIIFTLMYSLPLWPFKFAKIFRKAGFLKTTLLSFTWAFVTVSLPAEPVLYSQSNAVITLFAARFFFMLMLCSIFDHRDQLLDKNNALHSLATDLSAHTLRIIMIVVFILYISTGFFVRYHFEDDAQIVAFLLTGIFVWIAYKKSLKKQGYIFYYFLIDGLMLLTALMSWIANLIP